MDFKRIIYLLLTMVLGLILSFAAHGLIEIFYINFHLKKNIILEPSTLTPKCFLPSWVQIFLLIAGLLGGYFLGQKWWKIVYVEKRFQKQF